MAKFAHRILKNGRGKTKVVELTARMAIMEHCKECMGFNVNEVRYCTSPLCSLFPFRIQGTPKLIMKQSNKRMK